MSNCNNCGDFKIYNDCCDDKDPEVLTRVGLKDGNVISVSIDYLVNKFSGINLDSGDEEFDNTLIPVLTLNNVPVGTIFSLILNIETSTGTGSININGSALQGSISSSDILILVGKTSSKIIA